MEDTRTNNLYLYPKALFYLSAWFLFKFESRPDRNKMATTQQSYGKIVQRKVGEEIE